MNPGAKTSFQHLDLAAIRRRLEGARGQQYWQSLDEIAETPEFVEMLHREFPDGACEWEDGVSRRSFLKMAAASLALSGLTACTKQPIQSILPYVSQPEEIVPGIPLYYATAMQLGGFATGVLVKNREGHPIKVDGNPDHPAALGGSSVWMQASILDLYDPDRSQTVTHHGEISSWGEFISALSTLMQQHKNTGGKGLRVLAEPVTSPTLSAQLEGVLQRFPNARLHQYEPVSRDNARDGARLAFGEPVETHYRFDKAEVVVSLESDFLYAHPQRLRYTREFTDGRRVAAGKKGMNRLYVFECTPSVTGSVADHRFPRESGRIASVARQLAAGIGSPSPAAPSSAAGEIDAAILAAIIRDLQRSRGSSVVIAGESQPPIVHALAHWMNHELGSVGRTVFHTSPAELRPVSGVDSLKELVEDMRSGAVETLLILGGNPVYNAPADLEFGPALSKVTNSIHLGLELDETAALSAWHIPQAHYLESWGDASSFDGTVTLQQPLIAPLYDGKTAMELLGVLDELQPARTDYEIVRAFWQSRAVWVDFEKGWRRALHDGMIAGTALPERSVSVAITSEEIFRNTLGVDSGTADSRLELTFRPDPCLWDGRFANNGFLQECAKPVTKIAWDNAVHISPALAERLDVTTNDIVEVGFGGRSVRGPVWVTPGQAVNSVTLHLGFGRKHVGRIGTGVGFDVYPVRTTGALWTGTGVALRKVAGEHRIVSTQTHHNLDSEERQVLRQGTLQDFVRNPEFVKQQVEIPETEETLYSPGQHKFDGAKWAMSINLTTCIGCNACLLACNVENNIPVVGRDQLKVNREMYWIRIDTYFKGPLDDPQISHMPVPCMHCEHAPCELVCPVAATVHDHEGLNLMIYNRCVGTRFCSNNCPYKVRRFNFLRYTDYHTPSLKPMYNPEVTVRWRGVMEKCTYCVQRIAAARITAEKENRAIRDGEVQTACQQACPARAIVFGDLNQPGSAVGRLKEHPLDYPMLGQLNTRPRTTYLARLQNRNQDLSS